jgi:hypothetical protein
VTVACVFTIVLDVAQSCAEASATVGLYASVTSIRTGELSLLDALGVAQMRPVALREPDRRFILRHGHVVDVLTLPCE